MGTTITIPDDETKEKLDEFRIPDHDNYGDTLESIFRSIPTPQEIFAEGCTECGNPPKTTRKGSVDHLSGVTHRFIYDLSVEHEKIEQPVTSYNWFCSVGCAAEFKEKVRQKVPRLPDVVVVGGDKEMQTPVFGARFYAEDPSVSIDTPGAFTGEPENADREYDYHGEPVYIGNENEWVKRYTVSDVVHEDTLTTLELDNLRVGHEYEDPGKKPVDFEPERP